MYKLYLLDFLSDNLEVLGRPNRVEFHHLCNHYNNYRKPDKVGELNVFTAHKVTSECVYGS